MDIRVLALSLRVLDSKRVYSRGDHNIQGKIKALTQPSLAYYAQTIKYHSPCASKENDHGEF